MPITVDHTPIDALGRLSYQAGVGLAQRDQAAMYPRYVSMLMQQERLNNEQQRMQDQDAWRQERLTLDRDRLAETQQHNADAFELQTANAALRRQAAQTKSNMHTEAILDRQKWVDKSLAEGVLNPDEADHASVLARTGDETGFRQYIQTAATRRDDAKKLAPMQAYVDRPDVRRLLLPQEHAEISGLIAAKDRAGVDQALARANERLQRDRGIQQARMVIEAMDAAPAAKARALAAVNAGASIDHALATLTANPQGYDKFAVEQTARKFDRKIDQINRQIIAEDRKWDKASDDDRKTIEAKIKTLEASRDTLESQREQAMQSGGMSQGGPDGSPVKVTDKAGYDAIPDGSQYTWTDGKTYTKGKK